MANFTCDICGGTIKMQGSQGGVCQNCGMEYDLEAIRAKVNASPQQQTSQPVMVQPRPQNTQQGVIDRQALLKYLNDLRTMETIIYEDEHFKRKQTVIWNTYDADKIKSEKELKNTKAEIAKTKELEPYDYPRDKNNKTHKEYRLYYTLLFTASIILFITGVVFSSIYIKTIFLGALIIGLLFAVVPLSLALYFWYVSSNNIKLHKLWLEDSLKLLEGKRIIQEKAFERAKTKYDNLRNSAVPVSDINKEINETEKMLKKAYDANIIPLQFRTIEGVYYLYDYLSTSNQTLAEALLQANLEAIKQRLDQVIATQGKLIVEQQQTNAKLANIQQTNQQILQNAQRMAYNTAQAAQYAQIAATNTELLTKLNKKQLAYQRADFWLK